MFLAVTKHLHWHRFADMSLSDPMGHVNALTFAEAHTPVRCDMLVVELQQYIALFEDAVGRTAVSHSCD